ncbi:hypothetical protein ACFQ36_06705 [Arthrobacter sp. GCM10027362]|uniref:hypothetical protein n=1 Tax=Arthrobacter sp. GCM10027362 TaxID=3273379 RepID=UPI00363D50BC
MNARRAWYAKELSLPVLVHKETGDVDYGGGKPSRQWAGEDCPVPAEHLRLLRHMAKRLSRTKVRRPDLSEVNTMLMDGAVAQVEAADARSRFDYWVRISTLDKRRPVRIPLTANRRFNEAPGELSNFVQVSVTPDRSVRFVLVKKSPVAGPRPQDGQWLGLDFGMVALFATGDGRLLGQAVLPYLSELDRQAVELARRSSGRASRGRRTSVTKSSRTGCAPTSPTRSTAS